MQNVPQDILDDAERLYPESLYKDSINVQRMYIHGRMDERDRNNATIQSQSDKIEELQEIIAHQGRSILTSPKRHFEQMKELQQSQSVQTTGSVREIAKREFDKLSFADGITSMVNPFENKAVARSWWNQAYDSAARNLPVDNGWTDDSLWDAYHKGYSDGHSDGVLYDMDREDRPVTQSYTDWLAEYKLAHSQITPKEESRMSAEEIRKLAEKKYGTDLHSFGQQRDGYVFGYQECLATHKQSQVDVEKVAVKFAEWIGKQGEWKYYMQISTKEIDKYNVWESCITGETIPTADLFKIFTDKNK